MAGLGHLSSRPYLDPWEPPPPCGERASSARLARPAPRSVSFLRAWAGSPAAGSEAVPRRSSPTARPRRPGYTEPPWETQSLTDVPRRPLYRARRQRPGSRRPENAWGEAGTKGLRLGGDRHGLTWQPLRHRQPQPWQHYPPAQGDWPPPSPPSAYTPSSGTVVVEKEPNGNQWAVPICRGLGCSSLSSVPTEKSSVLSKVSTPSVCAYLRDRGSRELTESLVSQHWQLEGRSPGPVPSRELHSRHTQLLKKKLAEVVISSRDQKIVALVLARLQKAQRMRELQQQAAVAWEELKRSDRKVQMTLERERRRLLQQNQDQWQQEKEQRAQQDIQVKNRTQKEGLCSRQLESQESRCQRKVEGTSGQADSSRQCQLQQVKEHKRVRELQKRLEQDCHKRHQHTLRDLKAQETNLTSMINYQARKVLMDCQAKAEELLRKLSLEQRSQLSPENHQYLVKERPPELREKAQKEDRQLQQVKWHARESEEQGKMPKRMLTELVNQKIQQARMNARRNIKDKVKHARDPSVLQEKSQHILKLKAEKEEKCHIEGIKEAIKKKQQRIEQISREREAALEEYQKISRTSSQMRDKVRPLHCSSLGQVVWET